MVQHFVHHVAETLGHSLDCVSDASDQHKKFEPTFIVSETLKD